MTWSTSVGRRRRLGQRRRSESLTAIRAASTVFLWSKDTGCRRRAWHRSSSCSAGKSLLCAAMLPGRSARSLVKDNEPSLVRREWVEFPASDLVAARRPNACSLSAVDRSQTGSQRAEPQSVGGRGSPASPWRATLHGARDPGACRRSGTAASRRMQVPTPSPSADPFAIGRRQVAMTDRGKQIVTN